MRRILIIGLLFTALLTGCIQADPRTDASTVCDEDINAAKQASDKADVCTAEFAVMQCPHDSSVTYEAGNGCQISELENRGWERS